MTDFLLIVVAAVVIAGLVFGVFAFAVGREAGLSDPEPDGSSLEPAPDRALTADDLAAARFDVTVRGYRMAQVDALLARAAEELQRSTERVDALEREVAELRRVPDGHRA